MARSLNGSSDKIVIGSPSATNISGQITMYARGYFAALPTGSNIAVLLSQGYAPSNIGYFIDWDATSGSWRAGSYIATPAGPHWCSYVSTPSLNTWYSLVFTWDGTNRIMDINGTQVDSAFDPTGGAFGNTGAGLYLGAEDITGSPARFLNGRLAEVAIWDVGASVGERKALAAGVPPPLAKPGGLKAYWPLLGDSPEPDYSGNRNSGTLTGTTVANHPGVRTLLWVPRSFTPDAAASGTTTITVALAGTSSLTATATEYHRFTVALAGTSSLTATVTELHRFSVSLAGTSALTATVTPYQRITTTLAGTSSLAATVTPLQRITATLAGTSALTATLTPYQRITPTLAGTSSLAVTLTRYQRLTVALAGTSSLTAAFSPYDRFTVTLAGASSLTAAITEYHRITATLAGSSSLAASVTRYQRFTVTVAGTSALATTLSPYRSVNVTLTGTSTLTAVIPVPVPTHVPGHGTIIDRAPYSGYIIDRSAG